MVVNKFNQISFGGFQVQVLLYFSIETKSILVVKKFNQTTVEEFQLIHTPHPGPTCQRKNEASERI